MKNEFDPDYFLGMIAVNLAGWVIAVVAFKWLFHG